MKYCREIVQHCFPGNLIDRQSEMFWIQIPAIKEKLSDARLKLANFILSFILNLEICKNTIFYKNLENTNTWHLFSPNVNFVSRCKRRSVSTGQEELYLSISLGHRI